MNPQPSMTRLHQLLRQLEQTQYHELSCAECFEQIADDVDLQLAGESGAEYMPLLRQHLLHCRVCREEHAVLLDLARLAADDEMPPDDDLLPEVARDVSLGSDGHRAHQS